MFVNILLLNFLRIIKKIHLHLFGLSYFFVILFFLILIRIDNGYIKHSNSAVWIMLLNILLLSFLWIFVMLQVIFVYKSNVNKNLIVIEKREGVKSYQSFIARLINVFIFSLIYELNVIFVGNLIFIHAPYKIELSCNGFFNILNYQPLITIFLVSLSIFIICLFNLSLAIVTNLFFIIIYCFSPVVSMVIVDTKYNYSTNAEELKILSWNIPLGKSFYNFAYDNNLTDIYDVNYINDFEDITGANFNNVNYFYNRPGLRVSDLFTLGRYDQLFNDSNLNKFKNLSLFNKIIIPILNIKEINMNKEDKLFYSRENSIFDKKHQTTLFKEYLNEIIETNSYENKTILNLLIYLRENIDDIVNTYLLSREHCCKSSFFDHSCIPLGTYNESDFSNDDNKTNYMKCALIWETLTLYNLSLNPILIDYNFSYDNSFHDYDSLKKYSNKQFILFDSLCLTNHLYTILNFKENENISKDIEFNMHQKTAAAYKCILKPFNVNFKNDESLSSLIKNDELDFSNPYSRDIKIEKLKNTNVTLMRICYPMFAILLFYFSFLLFKRES